MFAPFRNAGGAGKAGKEVELQKDGGFLQWRRVGEAWTNLLALADLVGPKGDPGAAGRGISSSAVNASGHLIVTYTTGTTQDLGVIVGAKGDPGAAGRGITAAAINANGHLIVSYSDGSTQDAGLVSGGGGGSVATGVPTRVPKHAERITASGTWSKAASDAAAGVWTEAEFVAVGGGASGWLHPFNLGQTPHGGGFPGCVRSRVLSRAVLPDTAAVTIGAGGASPVGGNTSVCNAGGTTTVAGVVQAFGGGGFNTGAVNAPVEPATVQGAMARPSDVPYGAPGSGAQNRSVPATQPSYGPGAGGGGASGSNNTSFQYPGGAGGASNAGSDTMMLAGGAGGSLTTPFVAGHGAAGAPPSVTNGVLTRGTFGSGGGGGSSLGSGGSPQNSNLWAGSGGFPGGGGGGAGKATSNSSNTFQGGSGAGGAGCVDVIYWQWTLA